MMKTDAVTKDLSFKFLPFVFCVLRCWASSLLNNVNPSGVVEVEDDEWYDDDDDRATQATLPTLSRLFIRHSI